MTTISIIWKLPITTLLLCLLANTLSIVGTIMVDPDSSRASCRNALLTLAVTSGVLTDIKGRSRVA